MQKIADFRTATAPTHTNGHDDPFNIAANVIASAPDNERLTHLVRLMTAIQSRGVNLSMHWDCLLEALCLEIEEDDEWNIDTAT